jgi:hypothetical protein
VLTRFAARIGMTPNHGDNRSGSRLCVAATYPVLAYGLLLGSAWSLGLIFMVLDTVDGKLARCTITSSEMGPYPRSWHRPDPPALSGGGPGASGLAHGGWRYRTESFALVMGAVVAGYVLQRVIEGLSIKWTSAGWTSTPGKRFDSDFRLITARRNPNMVILLAATRVRSSRHRPDRGGMVDGDIAAPSTRSGWRRRYAVAFGSKRSSAWLTV